MLKKLSRIKKTGVDSSSIRQCILEIREETNKNIFEKLEKVS